MLGHTPVDGPVWNLDGADTTLLESLRSVGALEAAKSVLMLGSYTCPVFRKRSRQVLALAQAHKIPLVFVYIYEAHVADGWQIGQNSRDGIVYNYPNNNQMDRSSYGVYLRIRLKWVETNPQQKISSMLLLVN